MKITSSSEPTDKLSTLICEFVALFHARACHLFPAVGVIAVNESPMLAVMADATSFSASRRSVELK